MRPQRQDAGSVADNGRRHQEQERSGDAAVDAAAPARIHQAGDPIAASMAVQTQA